MTGEPVVGGVGVSDWWPAPMKRWSKRVELGS